LLLDSTGDLRGHFDSLYRLLAWAGISVAAVLLVDSGAVITLLFTSAYADAVGPMTSLAPAAAILPLVQLGLWTLVAQRQWAWSIALATAKLVVIVPFVVAALLAPQLPLWVLGAGHTAGAAAALVVAVVGLRHASHAYEWRPWRIAVATVAGLFVAAAMRTSVPTSEGPGLIVSFVLLCAAVVIVTGVAIWTPEIRSTLLRLRAASRPGAVATGVK
jgi:O-antigen/teichoic acid export membrane protein